jgi:hypothetical protein
LPENLIWQDCGQIFLYIQSRVFMTTNHTKIISLKLLYDFVLKASADKDLIYALRNKKGYNRLCRNLVKPIVPCQGFYLWDGYDKTGS